MKKIIQYFSSKNERGVTLALVALLLFVFLGVGALVVDLGLLYAARNELQNAADAGALAGARVLYNSDGQSINTSSNSVARDAAMENFSHGSKVEVDINEVQRGHWSFGLGSSERGFYPSDSATVINISNFTEKQLDEMDGTDGNPPFINAIRVTARRDSTLVTSFFSRIFNYVGFKASAQAVAYIGYAGYIEPYEIDYPLAICRDSLIKQTADGEKVDCTVGTYISNDNQTARWTNFVQPCSGAANAASVSALMNPCGKGNPNPIFFGQGVTVMKGTQASSGFSGPHNITDCWKASDTTPQYVPRAPKGNAPPHTTEFPNDPWTIKLLVIDCNDNSQTCKTVVGVVTVNVLWTMGTDEYAQGYVPVEMSSVPGFVDNNGNEVGSWASLNTNYLDRWDEFAQHFNLLQPNGLPAEYNPFTLYFHKNCDLVEPTGLTGGNNFGVMARIPVLVR